MYKINYLIPSNKNQILVGRVVFLKEYLPPSVDFPYFYLNSQDETLYYANWPDLVPYLYNKTLGFFTTINNNYRFKNAFEVYSFFVQTTNQIVLKFTNTDSIKAIMALNEDRELYYFENNNSYDGWNRTITPKSDIKTSDNVIFLFANNNYKINSITIQSETLATLTISILNSKIYNDEQFLNDKNIEFGLYRIADKGINDSVIYTSVKSKYFSTPSSNDFFGGLRTRSQIIGHTHEHTHNMNNHTHTLSHTHDLRNHVHYMNHQHNYDDVRSDSYDMGTGVGDQASSAGGQYDTTRSTNYTRDYTDGPSVNSTGNATQSTTSFPDNNLLTNISAKTINNDSGLYTDSTKFKYGDKNNYDSIVYFAYIYGASYIVS